MRIELLGHSCPLLPGVTVGVQQRSEVVDAQPAAGANLSWRLEARLVEGPDLRGPAVHGRRGARFLYLSWQRSGEMFRRAKLMLDAVPAEVLEAADTSGLQATFGLTMADGTPLCAALRPPAITWRAS